MSGVEINLQELGDDNVPGLRVEVGLDELREALVAVCEHQMPTTLHFGGTKEEPDEMHGLVAEVGAGILLFDAFGDDEDQRTIVPLNKITWAKLRRPT